MLTPQRRDKSDVDTMQSRALWPCRGVVTATRRTDGVWTDRLMRYPAGPTHTLLLWRSCVSGPGRLALSKLLLWSIRLLCDRRRMLLHVTVCVCVCVCVFNIFFKNVFLHILMRVKISNSDFFSCCLFWCLVCLTLYKTTQCQWKESFIQLL